MAEAQRGNLGAFNELVRRHQGTAYAIALRMTGDEDLAADIAQDAFIAAYQRITSLRGVFRPWLCRIVVNGCYDALRKRKPEVSLESLQDADDGHSIGEQALGLADPSQGPEDRALQAELRRGLQRALASLPEGQRAVVVLVDVQGLSYQEAAEALRCELGTLKSRLNRARLRLRGELSGLLGRQQQGEQ